MSYVTTAILSFDIGENFEEDLENRIEHPIIKVNEWLESNYNERLHRLSDEMGNGNVDAQTIWIGLFNHLGTDEMVNVVKAQNWRIPQGVEVIFKGMEDDNLTLLRLSD